MMFLLMVINLIGVINVKGRFFFLARLDRFVCNYEWHLSFSNGEAETIAYFDSDHRPISLILQPTHIDVWRKGFETVYL